MTGAYIPRTPEGEGTKTGKIPRESKVTWEWVRCHMFCSALSVRAEGELSNCSSSYRAKELWMSVSRTPD